MSLKIDFIILSFLMITGSNILAAIGSVCVILYYISMLKVNVINKHYKGRWKLYFQTSFKSIKVWQKK